MNKPFLPTETQQPVVSGTLKSHLSRRRRQLISVAAILATVAVFASLFAWRQWLQAGTAPAEWPPVTVSAMQLKTTEVPASLEAVGSLRAVREVLLSPESAGRVVSIGFEQGQSVDADTVLVQLYDAAEQADRAAARARADLAKAQLTRSQRLSGSGAEAREILDQRVAEHNQALAAIRQLDARIEQKQVRAPFAGRVGIRQIDLGQYLNPGEAIASLTDTRELYVDFSVPQQQLGSLQTGSSVHVSTDAWPNREFLAKVQTIEPRVNPDTRNIVVRALLPNPDNALRPGMFVNATLLLPSTPNQLVVPTTAILTSAAGDSVLVVRGENALEQGQAEAVRVTLGRRLGDRVVVHDGLHPGDVVVTEGQLKVQPGAQVQVVQLLSAQES